MPTLKRAREASTEATDTTPTKRARLGPLELQLLDKDTLIKRILGLQDDIDTLSASAKNSPAAAGLSEKQIYEKVLHVRKLMVKGIKSQMKWKPSCKTGTAKVSYSGMAAPEVFRVLFGVPRDSKIKGGKFTLSKFYEAVGEIVQVSVRYDYLSISGEHVTVRWKEAEQCFTVSGSYGK